MSVPSVYQTLLQGELAAQQAAAQRKMMVAMSAHEEVKAKKPLGQVLKEAGHKAIGGGVPGAVAMSVQVLSLMWLRTTVNYQYRYGTSTTTALRTLYKEGGVRRFYRGLAPALVQGPLSRFGDTAANAGMLALMESNESTANLPIGVKTMGSSAAAGGFRIFLMPVDTLKTIMQVEGKNGMSALGTKLKAGGPRVLYHGALAASAATFVGHYPWFATYNYLNHLLPRYDDDLAMKLGRSALLGFCSSFVSDVASNSIRVIKTAKQTTTEPLSYTQIARSIIEKDGVLGLMGRGLKTKILANGLQGILFSMCWRIGQDWWNSHMEKGATAATDKVSTVTATALSAATLTARTGGSSPGAGGSSGSGTGGGQPGLCVSHTSPPHLHPCGPEEDEVDFDEREGEEVVAATVHTAAIHLPGVHATPAPAH